ncbi:hypothetical protein FHS18_000814 [Paenibacillus phyllosphaerae]|uniref:Uncharacterized protein n=1 Tax=Paenibacillus phyllosphaerae TaxID=274593 RepID=A0A7W5AV70_9BACL|nr:hypothetical protein [Paenibacillus phyllosphaerae]MBB3108786.1 hypothetical protein [Paenibacillus phyllosphaerae]
MKRRIFQLVGISLVLALLGGLYYVVTEQERISKRFAASLYAYPLPEQTSLIERDYFYGYSFVHLLGSGGAMPVIVSMQLSTTLSQDEVIRFYQDAALFPYPGSKRRGVELELYFEGEYDFHEEADGHYYTNKKDRPTTLKDYASEPGSTKTTAQATGKELRYILQLSSAFDYVLNID